MRIIELAILIICTILPFVLSKNSSKSRPFLLITPLVLIFSSIVFEGYRWQMIPAYFIILTCVLFIYLKKSIFYGSVLKKTLIGFSLLLILSVSWIIPNIFPVFRLPELTGSYQVGARDLHLKTKLDEIITEDPNDKRELMIKAWFPAKGKVQVREPYLNKSDRQGFALKYGLPETSFDYLDLVKTHTSKNVEVASGVFPVLLFSHGHYSKASGYYAIIEEIVSHGYIVLAINHTYESVGSEFPDGRVKYFNHEYDTKKLNKQMANLAWWSAQNFLSATTETEKRAIVDSLVSNYYATEIAQRWARDLGVVIDELEVWNSQTFLSGHIDLGSIGAFGHSHGGATIGQAMVNSSRIKAGLNVDGVQWGTVFSDTIRRPFALISSDWPDAHPDFNSQIYREDNMKNFTSLHLRHSGHASFMDIPYIINISGLNEAGSINKRRASAITSEVVVRFFNEHLKNQKKIGIEELANKYPELTVER